MTTFWKELLLRRLSLELERTVARVDGDRDGAQGVGLLASGASHPLKSLRPGGPLPSKGGCGFDFGQKGNDAYR